MIVKNIVVTNGEYTTRDGETKRRYLTIGQMHEHEGRNYLTLDAHINLAGLIRKEGDTRVFANLYDPRPSGHDGQNVGPRANAGPSQEPFEDDDVPF